MSYIAYKGFNSNLGTNQTNIQYQVGGIYSKENPVKNPTLCTNEGFHYCDRLIDTFTYYPLKNYRSENNRFCEIEVLGNFTKGGSKESWKNTTTSFKIIRELSIEEIEEIKQKEENDKKDWEFKQKQLDIPKNVNLHFVKEIQQKYPMIHVGGSTGLFLHGVRLKRWMETTSSDLDMVLPYFVLLEGSEGKTDEEGDITIEEIKKSGNDFDNALIWNSDLGTVKIDLKVDPHQQYEIIEYEGFRYKVSKLETILEAKLRYSTMFGGEKHRNDIYEICGKIKK